MRELLSYCAQFIRSQLELNWVETRNQGLSLFQQGISSYFLDTSTQAMWEQLREYWQSEITLKPFLKDSHLTMRKTVIIDLRFPLMCQARWTGRFQLRNCSKPASWHFQLEWKIYLSVIIVLSWAASTSLVLFPLSNATCKAKGVTHSLAAAGVFGRSRSWNNPRGELRSLINLWMGWRRLHKREKGSLLWTLSAGEKWSSRSRKGPFWPCLIIIACLHVYTKTLYPPMHTVEPL